MSIDRLPERLAQIASRLPLVRGRGEEATKQALVLPLLDALGYDIWNPSEVCPEFEADFAIKKAGQKEKVDLAIVLQGEPRIFIEVKPIDFTLDGHEGQLARYFNGIPTVSLAVLTNGNEYRFYTDTGEPNLLDAQPFFAFRLDAFDVGQEVLTRFHRAVFSPTAIRDFATELNYTSKLTAFLRDELDLRHREPSDALVRWILGSAHVYEGRVMASVVERFRPIVRSALQSVLKDIVRRSIVALDQGVTAAQVQTPPAPTPSSPPVEPTPAPVVTVAAVQDRGAQADGEAGDRARIQTTARELAAFGIIKEQFARSLLASATLYDSSTRKEAPLELGYKDTTGYFGVYFNKPSFWFARLSLEGKTPWVGLNLPSEQLAPLLPSGFTLLPASAFADTRIAISSPEDLHRLGGALFAAMQRTVDERRNKGDGG